LMKKAIVTFFLFLTVLFMVPSCGKKAPPFLRQREPLSARVVDLEGKWVGDDIVLRGIMREEGANPERKTITGLRVYYAEYPLASPPCEGCPLEFEGYRDFGREVLTDGGVEFTVKGKNKERIYYFKAHLMGDKGLVGPPSNIAKVVSGKAKDG